MKFKAIALSLFALIVAPQVAAESFLLGSTVLLEARNNHAIINVPACRYAKEIQLRAERDTFVTKVIVNFQSGGDRTFQFQRKLDKNEKTDWRKFSYPRCVSSIKVHGRAERGSAGIKVFGRK